jgi:hypothetical protein
MKLNISKTKIIPFSRKTNLLIYEHKICQSHITRTDTIKEVGIFMDSKRHFHNHVNYIFSHCIKLLGLVRNLTFSFASLERVYTLYYTLVRSKLEYGYVLWNSITSADANTRKRMQQKFSALCFNRVFPQVHYSYAYGLEKLKLHILCTRTYHLHELFLI